LLRQLTFENESIHKQFGQVTDGKGELQKLLDGYKKESFFIFD
jgi:hypothetical protein